MSTDRLRDRQTRRQVEPGDALPETGGPSPLLQQAQGFADVAREENENCARGVDAETALNRRRNTSGQ